VNPLIIYKIVDSTVGFLSRTGGLKVDRSSMGNPFHGAVDHFIDEKRVKNTKFNTNLTIQAV
jgi:hypothetical protein